MTFDKYNWKKYIPENHVRPPSFLEDPGVLLINKPVSITSMDVLRFIKTIGRPKKAGHAGTLDPFASGLLVVLLNQYTKLSDKLMAQSKEYEGTFILGETYDTQDITGTLIKKTNDVPLLKIEEIQDMTKTLTGNITQIAPAYSAKKKDGKPLYRYAREGKEIEAKKQDIFVKEFLITQKISNIKFAFKITCGKGTYIRTLINDLGELLKCGAVTETLIRTKSGNFSINECVSLENLQSQEAIKNNLIQQNIAKA
ncbi:MAG: tRNA pseudouridine(55) synthase TruB [Spirochaetia bacterium]|nr:tRNA pseudouridine(55) synthase TruB [Spirochaetia bacterium]